jgi:hypothetical protein
MRTVVPRAAIIKTRLGQKMRFVGRTVTISVLRIKAGQVKEGVRVTFVAALMSDDPYMGTDMQMCCSLV